MSKRFYPVMLMVSILTLVSKSNAIEITEDVIYLKHGEVDRGKIIATVKGKTVKLVDLHGTEKVYKYSQIQCIVYKGKVVYGTRPIDPEVGTYDHLSTDTLNMLLLRNPKSPTVSGLLSALIPGIGQAYNGESHKTVWFLGGAIVGAVMWQHQAREYNRGATYSEDALYLGLLLHAGCAFGSIGDAVIVSQRINDTRRHRILQEINSRKKVFGFQPLIAPKELEVRLSLRF